MSVLVKLVIQNYVASRKFRFFQRFSVIAILLGDSEITSRGVLTLGCYSMFRLRASNSYVVVQDAMVGLDSWCFI